MNLFDDEKTETIDIPDFVEEKDTTSTSVDMSIFKMSDEELYDDVPKSKEKTTRSDNKKKSNSTLILCFILIIVLLLTSVVSVIYAIKQRSNVSTLETELTQVKAQNTDLLNQVSNLNAQLEDINKKQKEEEESGTKSDPNNKYPSGTVLYITEDGQGMGVREEPKASSDFVDQDILDWGDKVKLVADAVIDDNGDYWGKIDKGYIRIICDGVEWASIEEQ